ncbi:MAG: hypothetical protein ACUVTH_10990 [Thermogutta sp.]
MSQQRVYLAICRPMATTKISGYPVWCDVAGASAGELKELCGL